MKEEKGLYDNVELWENDTLGNNRETAKLASFSMKDLQEAIGLQPISLRMQKDVLDNLKFIAKHYGIGYQPLIKQILKSFVDSEMDQILKREITLQSPALKSRAG